MSLNSFEENTDDSEEREPNHTRAYIHKSDHRRVQNLSDRKAISTKEAYRLLINNILDEDGTIKPEARSLFPGEWQ